MKNLNFRFHTGKNWVYSRDFNPSKYPYSYLSEYFAMNRYLSDNTTHYIFTGKKDKNGKDIYEGDIVHGCRGRDGSTLTYHVKHTPDDDWTWNFPDGLCCSLEIIGNEIDNPDLIGDCFDPKEEREREKEQERLEGDCD